MVWSGRGAERRFSGTGLVPESDIGKITWRMGVAEMADTVEVRHQSGGWSTLTIKACEMGRRAFEGTERHVIWLDEEPPHDVYEECLIRTATTKGIVMVTFTPLDGITEIVQEFMAGIVIGPVPGSASRYTVNAGWDDVPHLDDATKEELLRSCKKWLRDARSKGIPVLGEGVVFPIDDEKILCDPFAIPEFWPRICGLDFGWDHPTAAVWLAFDPDNDVIYLTDCYAESEASIPVHAASIKARGDWIPVAWPHDGLQHDKGSGIQLSEQYRAQCVNMLYEHARFDELGEDDESKVSRTSVEAGLHEMLTRMETGRWKVFRHLDGWMAEKRIYRREKGKVVKIGDDRISASRYGMMMRRFATPKPAESSVVFTRRASWRTA